MPFIWEKLFLLALLLAGALGDLPPNFTPTSYDLSLSIPSDLNAKVNGTVTITLTCVTETPSIFLHWGSSLIPSLPTDSNLTISYNGGDPASVTFGAQVNAILNQLNITATTPTTFKPQDVVTVIAKFQTGLNTDNKGLFFRQYAIENNLKNNIYLSSLWPTFARELFPCLDEPQYIAPITLRLTYPQSWAVAASANASSTTAGNVDGTNSTIFNAISTSPNNFAFFLASNMSQEDYTVSRSTTKLSFWARKGLDPAVLSANAQFLAEYYYSIEDLLGFSSVITQLNVVMVPGLEEPYAGYGVIFIREDNYAQAYWNPLMEGMFKLNVVPVFYQFLRQFTEFSTHPKLWEDYWISPTIANYLQYTLLNTVMPKFDFTTDLEVANRQSAMALDSLPDTKPLWDTSVNTDSAASVQTMLNDPLKNIKGAAILNMLDQSLPAGAVFQTIKSFLSSYKTSVTSSTFLSQLKSISQTSPSAKKALSTTLDYWFNSTINPLEAITISSVTGQGTLGRINFTTTGFCSALNPTCSSTLPANFYLAATVGSKTDNRYYMPRQDLWVTNDSVVQATIDIQANDWVVANVKSTGYYRSTYDDDNWGHIISAMSSNDMNLVDRSQVLDDAFALALRSSQPLNFNITLRLALANLDSVHYRDWIPVQRGLRDIKNNLLGLSSYASYQKFAAGYFYNLDGFLRNTSIDPFEAARIRALFLEDMCDNDVPSYRTAAVANLTLLLQGNFPNTVPSSAYESVACCGGAYNSTIKAQYLWNILSDSTLDYYRRHYASIALGCLSNYTDVSQLMSNTMSVASKQLKPYMQIALEKVADRNPVKFLANFTQLARKFSSQLGAASVASLVVRAGRKINNNTQAAMLDELINNANIDPEVSRVAQDTKTAIGYRVTWLSTNNYTLAAALQAQAPASATTSGATSAYVTISYLILTLPALVFLLAV